MRTRKRFGQHFLHDPAVIARIVAAIDPRPDQALVEIGPGPGALTRPLLRAAGALDVVEIDRDLAAALSAEFAAQPGLRVHCADALRFDWAALAATRGAALRIVGNLPYNISTPLLFALLEHSAQIHDMHFMMQREVVARIAASPGSEHYGRLSVMLAPRVVVEELFDVGPGAFHPPPKVWSSVLRMVVRPAPPHWALSARFAALVTAAFGQRRKTLRNALRALLSAEAIRAAGVDPSARAETLSAEDYGRLALAGPAVIH